MKSVGRLHTLLSGTQQEPSAKLKEVLRYVRCGAVEEEEGHFLSHDLIPLSALSLSDRFE